MSGAAAVRPEVRLNNVDEQCYGGEHGGGAGGTACRADSLGVEWVTYGHVTFNGERQHEQRTEVLSHQEDNRKRLAEARPLQQGHVPFRLQLKEYLTHTHMHV